MKVWADGWSVLGGEEAGGQADWNLPGVTQGPGPLRQVIIPGLEQLGWAAARTLLRWP